MVQKLLSRKKIPYVALIPSPSSTNKAIQSSSQSLGFRRHSYYQEWGLEVFGGGSPSRTPGWAQRTLTRCRLQLSPPSTTRCPSLSGTTPFPSWPRTSTAPTFQGPFAPYSAIPPRYRPHVAGPSLRLPAIVDLFQQYKKIE